MKEIVALLVLTLFLYAVSGCDNSRKQDENPSSLEEVARQFVPKGATHVVTAEGLPWAQLNFDVEADSTDALFGESQVERAKVEGWKVCRSASDHPERFEDRTVSPARVRSQLANVYYRDDVFVIVIAVQDHSAPSSVDPSDKAEETNFKQNMVIARHGNFSDVQLAAESVGAKCDGGSP